MMVKRKDKSSEIAFNYDKHADIQAAVANELLEKLLQEKLTFKKILDIGCGTGRLMAQLKDCFPRSAVLGLDISESMVDIAKSRGRDSLVADAVSLPFKTGSFDLVISNVAYQWVSNLEKAFREAGEVLKKRGILSFSCFGSKTLSELRSCFKIEENPLPTKDSIYHCFKKANFHDLELNTNLRNKYFDNLTSILYWLKNVGANRLRSSNLFLTPQKLAKANDFYHRNYGNNGKVSATFEVIWARARKS